MACKAPANKRAKNKQCALLSPWLWFLLSLSGQVSVCRTAALAGAPESASTGKERRRGKAGGSSGSRGAPCGSLAGSSGPRLLPVSSEHRATGERHFLSSMMKLGTYGARRESPWGPRVCTWWGSMCRTPPPFSDSLLGFVCLVVWVLFVFLFPLALFEHRL